MENTEEPPSQPNFRGELVWVAWLCLVLWTRLSGPWLLVVGAAGLAVASTGRLGRARAVGLAALVGVVVVGFVTERADRRYGAGWDEYWSVHQSEVADRLASEFDALVARGDAAVGRLAAVAASGAQGQPLSDSLAAIQSDAAMEALAIVGVDGRLSSWFGSHHGRVPDDALDGLSPYSFSETPLFSHLYFTAEIPNGGGIALVASLLRADLPAPFAAGLDDFASAFEASAGEAIRITRADRASGPEVFDFGWPDRTLLSITVIEPSRTERRAEERRRLLLLATLLLGVAWLSVTADLRARGLGGPSLALVFAAAVLPFDQLGAGQDLVDPAAFLLPGPLGGTLGRVLAVGVALLPALALSASRISRGSRIIVGLVVATLFPLIVIWFGAAHSLELVGTADRQWIAFQFALTLALALPVIAVFAVRVPEAALGSGTTVVVGVALAAAFGLLVSVPVRLGPGVSPWWAALWALPAVLVWSGMGNERDRLSYLPWFAAVWLAGTAALPMAWSARTEARMAVAESQLDRLGQEPDPYLEFLLDRFAARVDALDGAGASDVELLYQGWRTSGLVDEGSPILLTLWSADNVPQQELRLGVQGVRPAVVDEMLPTLRGAGQSQRHRLDQVDALYLVSVPLRNGRLLTGVIPPRRTITTPTALGPLFASVQGADQEFLTLVPTLAGDSLASERQIVWGRNDEGWRGEVVVDYPDRPWAVFYTISIPAATVMFARGTLLLAFSIALFSLAWLLSVWMLRGHPPLPADWRTLFTSFRGRVTWTLFGFFLLSNALFGTLAYRTLSGASERTATALAERVVGQIADAYLEEGGEMELLVRRVGADLLEYREGELVGGSVEELIELGLYDGWVDPAIYEALEGRELLRASRVASLGDWRYVLAYRRLPDGDIVASPVPLRAGATALRRRDVADLLGFAIVLGPVLSLGLALLVGRALTRPIQTLQVASERVGSGNLAVHLPDNRVDEFGSVFDAFNRMVLRLGDARRELLQTTRRTEAIVEEAATGVIALDRERRVTVVNPRAEALLGATVSLAEPLPRCGAAASELADWLDRYYAAGVRESDVDFEWGERRIRGRARRIAREGRVGGVVLILEDVTDELKSERILAWGEMAKQVAHEVKNPLTPIKLSVQHLKRAWEDKDANYGGILEKNVGAILAEIDRLASISRSFSRFGAPTTMGAGGPLVEVDLKSVVEEILDLYQGGGEREIRLESELSEGLPTVLCRPDELKEVLVNFLENARAACPNQGRVVVGAVARPGEDGNLGVELSVEDNGLGIPPALLPRIFEPQFSTRSTGAGLGLAIVKRLVDSWGGTVDVRSEEDVGTRMTIWVPSFTENEPLGGP
ncbi:MAG: ATP-binding protein [Longimicrobiales bacterium]